MKVKERIKKALKVKGIPEQTEEPKVDAVDPNQHDFSFACITCQKDAHYLADMIASLPKGVELVIVNTMECKEDEEERVVLRFDAPQDGRHLRVADYHYKRWRFDKARNVSIDLCQREWVMWIDSDDRLIPDRHKDLLSATTLLSPFVGGVTMGCHGYQPPYIEGNRGGFYATPHLRIIRRSTGAKFRGIIHEQIDAQITAAGYTVVECDVPVLHVGYSTDRETLVGKMRRNVSMLCQQIATDPDYLPDYYRRCLTNNLHTLNEMEGF